MRKIVLILPVIFLLTARSYAQTSVEFIPTAGYTFASHDDFRNTYGRIGDGVNFGGSIKFNINRNTGIEVLYSHMSANTGLYYYGYSDAPINGYTPNLKMDYIMIGPVQSFTIPNSTVRPFIGALLGAAIFSPEDYSTYSKFAVGLQLGTNIYVSPRVGIQLKAQLLSPVDAAGGGFYFGAGSGAGIDTYSSIYQFSLNAGLIIGLGRILPEPVYHRPAHRPHYRYYY